MAHTQLHHGTDEQRAVVNELAEAVDDLEAGGVGEGTITTEALEAGILSADAAGRALIATDFFNAATILLKIADGAFAADAATRALFGAGIWEAAALATAAVTGAKIHAAALDQLVGTAGNGAGARTLTGAAVADKVTSVINLSDLADASASFEAVITVANQIQQTGTDLTAKVVLAHLTKA